jgi:hypothetical protein
MPAEPSRAVFLSYASQDAEAARRICDSLRPGGAEVWFDADGGLAPPEGTTQSYFTNSRHKC